MHQLKLISHQGIICSRPKIEKSKQEVTWSLLFSGGIERQREQQWNCVINVNSELHSGASIPHFWTGISSIGPNHGK